MKDMFDAPLPPLPDRAYYEHRDIGEEVRQKLMASEDPFGCILRGPAAWNPAQDPAYPLYGACKTNTEDNTEFVPFRYGSAVAASVETGEILMRLMREDGGKTPLERPRAPRPERPGLPRAKTYAVNDQWGALTPEDFRGGFGAYQAFLHAGDFQSEPIRFQVSRREGAAAAHPFEATLKAKVSEGPAPYGIAGASFDAIAGLGIPEAPGAAWSVGQPVRKQGRETVPVQGAFRFKGNWGKDWERLPLHILVAVRGERELDVNTLWIPRDRCRIQDGEYIGHFAFDLVELFRAPDGTAKPPPVAWVSLVHRGWRSPISRHQLRSGP